MADRPLILPGWAVRAVLDGRKTQHRVVIEPYYAGLHPFNAGKRVAKNLVQVAVPARLGGWIAGPSFLLRYAVGDRLWIRETWAVTTLYDGMKAAEINPKRIPLYCGIRYAATDERLGIKDRSSATMPRWASRLTLLVTTVRVQRVQDITEEDARAEGCKGFVSRDGEDGLSPQEEYRDLWESAHGRDAWRDNPWVAALTFRPIPRNIDMEA